ncbi:MAG: hypothetical protein IT258_17155 [Saprospiraceae bacterium]|nr:hypothetical protein [Saprospiraceae bacterium]
MLTEAVVEQPLASVAVTVCEPGANFAAVAAASPLSHLNEILPVPPLP